MAIPTEKTNINEIDISPLGLLITTYSSLQYHLRKYWSLFQIHSGWFLCLHRQIKGDDAMIPEVILSVRVIILYNKLYLVEGSFKRQEREREYCTHYFGHLSKLPFMLQFRTENKASITKKYRLKWAVITIHRGKCGSRIKADFFLIMFQNKWKVFSTLQTLPFEVHNVI